MEHTWTNLPVLSSQFRSWLLKRWQIGLPSGVWLCWAPLSPFLFLPLPLPLSLSPLPWGGPSPRPPFLR